VTSLFDPLQLRGTRLRNRIMVSPMCMYSAVDGVPQPWHMVHLGGLARGGAGLVMAEASSVVPEGRISPRDTGMWNDDQARAWAPIVQFVHDQGAVAAIQLAHAGNKASTYWPWASGRGSVPPEDGGWLLHQFLSPLSNDRTDGYGGDLLGRSRLLQEVAAAVRSEWPNDRPVLVRISATDWVEGGHTLEDSVVVAGWLRDLGVDLIDVSSGGISPEQRIAPSPGYQVGLAARIREGAGIPTAAVGLITEAEQAQALLADGSADLVALARVLLRDPQWPLRAAHELGVEVAWPPQLRRGRW
jgi:2,4-dienoyl-CoA reductase-like NADH-dependent reductase (Old Yellow Enzyme family)